MQELNLWKLRSCREGQWKIYRRVLTFAQKPWIWSFHVVVLLVTAKKCTNARAQWLFLLIKRIVLRRSPCPCHIWHSFLFRMPGSWRWKTKCWRRNFIFWKNHRLARSLNEDAFMFYIFYSIFSLVHFGTLLFFSAFHSVRYLLYSLELNTLAFQKDLVWYLVSSCSKVVGL